MNTDWDPISATLRSEERRVRRRIFFLTLIPIVVAAALILVTTLQVNDALKKRNAAIEEFNTTDSLLRIKKDSLRIVEADLVTQTEERTELLAFQETIRNILSQDRFAALDSASERQTRELLTDSAKAATITPRVYLQIIREDQRRKAQYVERYLEAEGFIVPGIELVRASLSHSELRFFRSGEETRAKEIQAICTANDISMRLQNLSRLYGKSTIRPGHYEIWFGDDF